jgi:ubiquinone/menaquinone biosynthesis C-methylase UbiE
LHETTSDPMARALEADTEGPAAILDPKTANVLFHDAAARSYDSKWAIAYDRRCVEHVRVRAQRMLPRRRYDRVLDVGCGTGFLLLNLWLAGYVGEPHGCDISPGMVRICAESARQIGCEIQLRVADAEHLPYADATFDLVVVHAVLHHMPDVSATLGELRRVLRHGGTLLVAGEPTTHGDRMAKAVGRWTAAAVRALARVAPPLRRPPSSATKLTPDQRIMRDLEWKVDLHTFVPAELGRLVEEAGFDAIRIETEELVSSLVGWAVRTVEAEVPAGILGRRWGWAAYRTYRVLSGLDAVLYRFLPQDLFYNLLLTADRPAS